MKRLLFDLLTLLSILTWAWAVTRDLGFHRERLKRLEYWVEVHHPLVPLSATPAQVKERGYWKGGR